MKSNKTILFSLVCLALPALTGCPLLGEIGSDDSDSSSSDTDTGSGGTLATSDLAGNWDSPCIAAGSMPLPTGHVAYKDWISVSGTTFMLFRSWYTAITNGYCDGTNSGDDVLYGTIAVGGLASGSTTLNKIQVTVTSDNIRGYDATIRSTLNTACALSLSSSTGVSVLGNACGGGGYAIAHPSSGTVVENVVSKTGTQLKLGALSTTMFIPGVLSGATLPTTTSVTFNKR